MAQRSGEFDVIARLLKPLAQNDASLALADDAAVMAPTPGRELVFTKDMLVEGVHFLASDPPQDIAAKALGVNLSDLAAMGGAPRHYLLGLSLNADKDDAWLEGFAGGLQDMQSRHGISVIGGDITSTPGPMTISVTAIGEVPAGTALRRHGAQPGDAVLVSGTIGDAALGLLASQGKGQGVDATPLIDRYRRPQPRLALGEALRGIAHAAIDVSDGLVADLAHIAEESGVRAVINAADVPLSSPARAWLEREPERLETVLTGGDDYELIVTVSPKDVVKAQEIAANVHIPLTLVGHIESGEGVVVIGRDGQAIPLKQRGFRHF